MGNMAMSKFIEYFGYKNVNEILILNLNLVINYHMPEIKCFCLPVSRGGRGEYQIYFSYRPQYVPLIIREVNFRNLFMKRSKTMSISVNVLD